MTKDIIAELRATLEAQPEYEQYEHHGKQLWVRSALKGQHREHCLCWNCAKFYPTLLRAKCTIADDLYKFDVKYGVTTPVWECAEFEECAEPPVMCVKLL